MTKLSAEVEQFFSSAQGDLDSALRAVLAPNDSPIDNLDDAILYALGMDEGAPSSGKRLRPLLCLLVSSLLSGQYRTAMPFATAIELMHNFALVHDDIEDGDEYRRGRPAVWKHYGLPHAINIGDYLFTKIFGALLSGAGELPPEKTVRFFALMGDTLDHTHRGQALDMNAREKRIDVDHYMRIVTEKTGYYLAAPLVAGAIAADAARQVEEALSAYGLLIGPLFQIRDDLIDLTHGKGRETIGSDIREGKRSFLVAYTCQHASASERQELLSLLDLPRHETGKEQIERAIAIFRSCEAFDEAGRVCDSLKERALHALAPLPEKLRDSLTEITHYLVARTT